MNAFNVRPQSPVRLDSRAGGAGECNFQRGQWDTQQQQIGPADPVDAIHCFRQSTEPSKGSGTPSTPALAFGLWLLKQAPGFFASSAAIIEATTTERIPSCDKRLKAMPPIRFNVAATALEHHIFFGVAKPELHRQSVALFRRAAGGNAVRVLSHAKAVSPIVGRHDPAHSKILSRSVGKSGAAQAAALSRCCMDASRLLAV